MKTLNRWASKSSITFGTLLHLELSILAMTAPAVLSQTYNEQLQQSTVPTQPDSSGQMNQLAVQWGFIPISCSPEVAVITSETAKVCVNPTPQLPAGNYTYNPGLNQIVPAINSQASAGIRKFTFTTVLEYSKCLESILQLYQSESLSQQEPQHNCLAEFNQTHTGRKLSKAQALELISSTNIYATTVVSPKIYPLRGQRERIAQMFQFIYEIDADDLEIQRIAAQS